MQPIDPRDAAAIAEALRGRAAARFDGEVEVVGSPSSVGAGFDSYIHLLQLGGAGLPGPWRQPLVVRVLPTADRADSARREADVQGWCADRAFPAPRVLEILDPGDLLDLPWLTLVLAYGFVARVLTGPKLSPLGQLVTRVITPRLPIEPRLVPGPPKRFAQAVGVAFTATAAVLTYGFDAFGAAQVVLGLLLVAASLEAFAGYCLGCKAFALLMRAGVIPASVCEECDDIWSRRRPVATS